MQCVWAAQAAGRSHTQRPCRARQGSAYLPMRERGRAKARQEKPLEAGSAGLDSVLGTLSPPSQPVLLSRRR